MSSNADPLSARMPEFPARQIFSLATENVWCPSPMADEQGNFHLFFSCWPKSLGFEAWVTHSRVARAVSGSPTGPWRVEGDVLGPRHGSGAWDAEMAHNPHLIHFDGRYYLYYTGNHGSGHWQKASERPVMSDPEWWVNRDHQRLGVAWADRLEGPWHRMDRPLIDPPQGYRTSGTPFVFRRPDNLWQMVFKAVREDGSRFGGGVDHFIALADHPLGPFRILPQPLFPDARTAFPLDDHCQWFENGRYWCLAKDHGENLAGFSPCLLLLYSIDGYNWQLHQPPFTQSFSLRWADGKCTDYERLEMPKFLFADGRPDILFLAGLPGAEHSSHIVMINLIQ